MRRRPVIAEGRGIAIRLSEAPEPITLNVSQPVFRQLVIYLLNELIGATAVDGEIEIALGLRDGEPLINIGAMKLAAEGR